MKFYSNKTLGGFVIETLLGPDADGLYAGIVSDGDRLHALMWDERGFVLEHDGSAFDARAGLVLKTYRTLGDSDV